MLLALAFGKPAEQDSSSVPFVRAIRGRRRVAGTALVLLVPLPFLLPVGGLASLAVLTVPLTVLVVLLVARRTFGGIGGDVVGTAGEATRIVCW
jgi:cobalamin synthase